MHKVAIFIIWPGTGKVGQSPPRTLTVHQNPYFYQLNLSFWESNLEVPQDADPPESWEQSLVQKRKGPDGKAECTTALLSHGALQALPRVPVHLLLQWLIEHSHPISYWSTWWNSFPGFCCVVITSKFPTGTSEGVPFTSPSLGAWHFFEDRMSTTMPHLHVSKHPSEICPSCLREQLWIWPVSIQANAYW